MTRRRSRHAEVLTRGGVSRSVLTGFSHLLAQSMPRLTISLASGTSKSRGWSRSLLRTLFAPGWARRRRRTPRVRGPPNRRRRRAQTSYGFLSGDLLHGDLAVFEVRGVAGVYDAGPVEAVLSILALPGTLPDGLDEALDNGIMSF